MCNFEVVGPTTDIPIPIENGVPGSRLQNVAKLDDPKTKGTIETEIKKFVDWLTTLIQHKKDFDKFCRPGIEYEGNYTYKTAESKVRLVFETINQNTAVGKITTTYLNIPDAIPVSRNFTVGVMALTRGKVNYRVKVQFTNLRSTDRSVTPTADVLRIEIFDVRNNLTTQPPGQTQRPWGPIMGPGTPPGMDNGMDMGSGMGTGAPGRGNW